MTFKSKEDYRHNHPNVSSKQSNITYAPKDPSLKSEASNNIESGRSMVEILGVLAIIGVISVGGIIGYTYAMNRYRTNELISEGYRRAYTVSTQTLAGVTPSLSEFSKFNKTAAGTFGDTVQWWGNEFGLTVSAVTKPVCENLIRTISDTTPLLAITATTNAQTILESGNCSEEKNDIYMLYHKDLIPKRGMGGVIVVGPEGSSSGGTSPSSNSSGIDNSPSVTSSGSCPDGEADVGGACCPVDHILSGEGPDICCSYGIVDMVDGRRCASPDDISPSTHSSVGE